MQSLSFELKLIRSALRLSVAETAQLFGVSRPAIYSWQNGSSIRPKNAERLQAIANAITPHMVSPRLRPRSANAWRADCGTVTATGVLPTSTR